jgi:hypothetical protein
MAATPKPLRKAIKPWKKATEYLVKSPDKKQKIIGGKKAHQKLGTATIKMYNKMGKITRKGKIRGKAVEKQTKLNKEKTRYE